MADKIPEGWRECRLGEVAEIVKDKYQPKKGDALIYIGLEHIQEQTLRLNSIGSSEDIASDKFYFRKGDVLFGKLRPYFRKVVQVDFDGVCSTDIWVIRPKAGVNQKYLLYLFANKELVDLSNFSESGTRMPRADWNFMSQTIWNIPIDQSEQHAIASVLSSLDDKIDLLNRENQTLEQMAEAIFRQWFIEEADEEWEEGKLGDVLAVIESGKRPKGGIDPDLENGIPSIGAENINGIGHYDYSKTKLVNEVFFQSMKKGIIKDYDVLIYKDGAYVGRKGMFGLKYPYDICTVNEHVFILRANDKLNQFFLYFILEQEALSQLNSNSAQPGLNQETIKSLDITIPPKVLVEEFSNMVKPWIDKILINAKQIRTLEKLRDTLLPKLMSGEVRVKICDA